jgi:predicted Zn-dependent peptidase
MKHRLVPALLAPLFALAACGGGASYTDVADAMQQAERARASKDSGAAESAYNYVLANSEAEAEQRTALLGLYAVQLSSDPAAAMETYGRLASDHADSLTVEARLKLIDQAIEARAVDTADHVLNDALAAYPDQLEAFSKPATAVDRLIEQGPDADLSSLGYTGD